SRGVTLAVDEALANIIRHAYKNRYDQEIELNCQTSADQMEFTLVDRGEPPDPARICGQPLDEGDHGRGVLRASPGREPTETNQAPAGYEGKFRWEVTCASVTAGER